MTTSTPHLRTVSSLLPIELRPIFHFSHFNHMQSIVAEEAFKTNENMVVAAPTGSGKTVIHELAICRVIQRKGHRPIRCVYIAPSKALCQQKWKDWNQKFTPLHQTVLELTGDVDVRESLMAIARASIVITTPEKWDSITRTWRDHVYLMSNIDLLLVDEIHHLGEDRGPTLEAVIVRMQYLASLAYEGAENVPPQGQQKTRMRIVGLSATLPNISDIGEWLNCKPRHIHYFDDTFRPVPLEIHTLNYGTAPNPFLFERSLDNKVNDVVKRYSNGRQVLVFCSSKKNAENVAEKLRTTRRDMYTVPADVLSAVNTHGIADAKLLNLIQHGIAYHHAGLLPDDRAAVEELYTLGHLRILCSTSTLAHGINLPAYLVIVKGTFSWRGSIHGYEKLRRSDIVQMIGRAGRPGYDTSGVAVVMTNQEDVAQYSNLTTGLERIHSQLINNIYEVINAEISQRVITSIDEAIAWMRTTFLFICVKKGLLKDDKISAEQFHSADQEHFVSELCTRTTNILQQRSLIQKDSHGCITPNIECHIMAKTLTKLKSMIILMEASSQSGIKEVISMLSSCEELHRPVRRDEKKFLNDCKQQLRFLFKEKVQTPDKKSYVLLQAAISRVSIKEFSLKVEQAEMVENGIRLLKCVTELAIYRNYGRLLESVIYVERALKLRLWETSNQNIFYQCKGVTDVVLERISTLNKTSIFDFYGMNIQSIQSELDCRQDEARSLLQFSADMVSAKLALDMSNTTSDEIMIRIFPAIAIERRKKSSVIKYQLVCYDTQNCQLICWRMLAVGTTEQEFRIPNTNSVPILRMRCVLLANVAGIDFSVGSYQHEEPTLAPASVATVSSAAKGTKKTKKDVRSTGSYINTDVIAPVQTPVRSTVTQNPITNHSETNSSATRTQPTTSTAVLLSNKTSSSTLDKPIPPDFSMFRYRDPHESSSNSVNNKTCSNAPKTAHAVSIENDFDAESTANDSYHSGSLSSFASSMYKRKSDVFLIGTHVKRIKPSGAMLPETELASSSRNSSSLPIQKAQIQPPTSTFTQKPFFDFPNQPRNPSSIRAIVQDEPAVSAVDISHLLQKANSIVTQVNPASNSSVVGQNDAMFDDAFL